MNIPNNEFAPFYTNYISLAQNLDFDTQMKFCHNFYKTIPIDKTEYRYLPKKWTIKDILLHIIDCERIFTYRALRIARNDKTNLHSFDENNFVMEANAVNREMDSLLKEYETTRLGTISLFESFSDQELLRIGNASGEAVSVRALKKMILGHELHHIQIIKERYL